MNQVDQYIKKIQNFSLAESQLGKFKFPFYLKKVSYDLFEKSSYCDKTKIKVNDIYILKLIEAAYQNDMKLHINYIKKANVIMEEYWDFYGKYEHPDNVNNTNQIPSREEAELAKLFIESYYIPSWQDDVCRKIIFGYNNQIGLPKNVWENFNETRLELGQQPEDTRPW